MIYKQIKFYERFDNSKVDLNKILSWYKGEKLPCEDNNVETYGIELDINGEPNVIGQGSNARAYKIKGNIGSEFNNCIVKIFFPIVKENALLDEGCRLAAKSDEKLSERLEAFICSYDRENDINQAYYETGRTKVLNSELFFSSLGICYISRYVGGALLYDYFKQELSALECLKIARETLNDITVYNEKKMIHADIKPQNFWCINFNTNLTNRDKFEVDKIRSLDFGSVCYAERIISDIRESFNITSQEEIKDAIAQIDAIDNVNLYFFESTGKYYSQNAQKEIIKMVIYNYFNQGSYEYIKSILLSLDIVAIFKMLYYCLIKSDNTDWVEQYDKNNAMLFTDIVKSNRASFKTYHIGFLLKQIYDKCKKLDLIRYDCDPLSVGCITNSEAKAYINDLIEIFENPNTYVRNHHNYEEFDEILLNSDKKETMQDLINQYGIDKCPADIIKDMLME